MSDRPSRIETLMRCAWVWADRSTCDRLHVGAVLSRDYRILVTGYNGPPSGATHCHHNSNAPCEAAVHAEANLIAFAARHGVETLGAQVIVTHMPCVKCAQLIINAGISMVTYDKPYRDPSGVQLLRNSGVAVVSYEVPDWMVKGG